jgi:hypothetical protein
MVIDVLPWHWRQALQIATQVPEQEADARIVLDCVEQLLNVCHHGAPEPPPAPAGGPDGQVLRFAIDSSTPRRRATSSGRPAGLSK